MGASCTMKQTPLEEATTRVGGQAPRGQGHSLPMQAKGNSVHLHHGLSRLRATSHTGSWPQTLCLAPIQSCVTCLPSCHVTHVGGALGAMLSSPAGIVVFIVIVLVIIGCCWWFCRRKLGVRCPCCFSCCCCKDEPDQDFEDGLSQAGLGRHSKRRRRRQGSRRKPHSKHRRMYGRDSGRGSSGSDSEGEDGISVFSSSDAEGGRGRPGLRTPRMPRTKKAQGGGRAKAGINGPGPGQPALDAADPALAQGSPYAALLTNQMAAMLAAAAAAQQQVQGQGPLSQGPLGPPFHQPQFIPHGFPVMGPGPWADHGYGYSHREGSLRPSSPQLSFSQLPSFHGQPLVMTRTGPGPGPGPVPGFSPGPTSPALSSPHPWPNTYMNPLAHAVPGLPPPASMPLPAHAAPGSPQPGRRGPPWAEAAGQLASLSAPAGSHGRSGGGGQGRGGKDAGRRVKRGGGWG